MKSRRIYIAGPLTPRGAGNHALEYLDNVRQMLQAWVRLIQAGWSPFCPAMDMLGILFAPGLTDVEVKRVSMDFLDVCDYIVLLPGALASEGVKKELHRATQLGKKVFTSVDEAIEYIKIKKRAEND